MPQIQIKKHTQTIETIDVELPYYYRHDLFSDHGDSIIYGKIEEKMHTSIQETKNYEADEKYEIEKEPYSSLLNSGLGTYFDEKYVSDVKEFEEVKQRCKIFLDDERTV